MQLDVAVDLRLDAPDPALVGNDDPRGPHRAADRPADRGLGTDSGDGHAFRADLDSGAPAGYTRAYEFYYAPFDHYFSTSDPVEIDGLDRGIIAGWTRTGASTSRRPSTSASDMPASPA